MSRNRYRIQPFTDALIAWPQSRIVEITVTGLAAAKQVAMNVIPDEDDWKHTINWHLVDGAWELCVEPRWGSHNSIARLSRVEAAAS